MPKMQITLTVNESKRMIANGIGKLSSIQRARKSGKIF